MKEIFLALVLIFGAIASTSGTITAQQKIDPTLEVKRDFDAKLLEITKGKLFSNFADSSWNFRPLFQIFHIRQTNQGSV